MKKMFVVFLSLVTLSGCAPTPEEAKNQEILINSKLPEGCSIHDLGLYKTMNGSWIPLVYIHCKNSEVTGTSTSYQTGKTKNFGYTFLIKD